MIRDELVLAAVACVGTLFWPLNPDAAVAIYTGRGGAPLLAVGLALAGQLVMLAVLHLAGAQMRQRWRWLDRKCDVVREKWGARLTARAPLVAGLSGLIGIPPSVATVMVGAALELPLRRLVPAFVIGRAVWFVAMAHVGRAFS